MNTFTTIDEYIATFPAETQVQLEAMRTTIKAAIPDAKEVISYAMPAFKANTVLVYFAGYKAHIGFYPTDSGIKAFEHKFGNYKYSKGAIQFPINEPLPLDLITEMTLFRAEEDRIKAALKKKK